MSKFYSFYELSNLYSADCEFHRMCTDNIPARMADNKNYWSNKLASNWQLADEEIPDNFDIF